MMGWVIPSDDTCARAIRGQDREDLTMSKASIIDVDLAKHVFQLSGRQPGARS
jgi:hypothetical protein